MVIHKCAICGKNHVNHIQILQSYICINCERNICNSIAFNNRDYSSYIKRIRQIWSDFILK
ncbi:sigma factor G inhibitor Gin [Abyssisolibacter fermentans]|uniref:sigma factor G inhibitor Gin n=1 Tax=Abyssisolibacter fermentans TaxID=1766203 RepID=UPI0008343E48